jgi:thioredoxin 1
MSVIFGDSRSFDVLTKDGLVLVDMFAVWCGPCKMIAPVLEDIASSRSDIKIVKIDVDQNQDLAMRYGVMSIPTLLLFKDGKPVAQQLGFMPKELLLKWVDNNNK